MRFSSPYVMRSSTVTGPSVFAGEPAAVRADSAAAASRPWNLDARVESGATLAESAPPRPMVSEGNGSRTALEQACDAVTRRRRDQRTPAPRGRRAARVSKPNRPRVANALSAFLVSCASVPKEASSHEPKLLDYQ